MDAERIYQIDHPQQVNRFEDVLSVDEDVRGYWISKPWLRGENSIDSSKLTTVLILERSAKYRLETR